MELNENYSSDPSRQTTTATNATASRAQPRDLERPGGKPATKPTTTNLPLRRGASLPSVMPNGFRIHAPQSLNPA